MSRPKKRRAAKRKPLRFTGVTVQTDNTPHTVAAEYLYGQIAGLEKRRSELAADVKLLEDQVSKPTVRVTKTLRWPASWFQHFKQDCFPLWAKARWPVQYEDHTYWEESPTTTVSAGTTTTHQVVGVALNPVKSGELVKLQSQ